MRLCFSAALSSRFLSSLLLTHSLSLFCCAIMRAPVVILFSLAPFLGTAVQLFNTPGDIPEAVPVRCRAALAQNITCSPLLITGQKAANGDYLSGSDLTTYCSSDCNASIKKFQTAVESACGKSSYSLYPNVTSTQVPLDVANGIAWAYNLVCIKDEYVWLRWWLWAVTN